MAIAEGTYPLEKTYVKEFPLKIIGGATQENAQKPICNCTNRMVEINLLNTLNLKHDWMENVISSPNKLRRTIRISEHYLSWKIQNIFTNAKSANSQRNAQ